MSFGMVLLAFFCPPAYFAARQRWVAFAIHCVLYLLALVTVFVFGIGFLIWLMEVFHAMWDFKSRAMDQAMQRQAEMIAATMAKAKEEK